MRRITRWVWLGVVCATAVASAAPASARELWVVEEDTEQVTVVDTATNSVIGEPIPVGEEARSIAFSPDGATAYVANRGDHTVSVINTTTKTAGVPFDLEDFVPNAVAISPHGARLYAAGLGGLIALDPSTGAPLGKPWSLVHPAPPEPADLAVTPDGTYAYAAMDRNDASVAEFDLHSFSGQEVGNRPHLDCTCDMRAIAVTPDGSRVLVGGDANGIINTATHALTALTTPGSGTADLAISPDGASAYAVGSREALWRYGLPSGAFDGSAVSPAEYSLSVAFNPAGDRVFLGGYFPDNDLYILDKATHAPIGDPIELEGTPVAMATTPDQPPVADLSASPAGGDPGVTVSFDAGDSEDPDGAISRYDWSFGDGAVAFDAGPKLDHTYSTAGSFQASVTVTDDERCSTKLVYTGRSAYCNGGPVARATTPIMVGRPPAGSSDRPPAESPGGPQPDTRAPILRLIGGSRQAPGRTVAVKLSCDEACTATATGKVTVVRSGPHGRHAATRFALGSAKASLLAGSPKTLRLSVPKAASTQLGRAGARGAAKVRIVAIDAAGNVATAVGDITVRRKG